MAKNHTLDASKYTLGRLAAAAASLLMGKNDPAYKPNVDSMTSVEVVNFSKIRFTGQKETQKLYMRHSGYVGSLKKEKLHDLMVRNPKKVLQLAVSRMLPDNKLRAKRMKRLKINL